MDGIKILINFIVWANFHLPKQLTVLPLFVTCAPRHQSKTMEDKAVAVAAAAEEAPFDKASAIMSPAQKKQMMLGEYTDVARTTASSVEGMVEVAKKLANLTKDYFATLDDRDEEAQDYMYELHAEIEEGLRAEVAARDTEIAALKEELAELRLSEEEREGQEE